MRSNRLVSMAVSFTIGASLFGGPLLAADNWSEMQSGHFKAWSNGGEGATRNLLWQLEQIRSAMTVLWPWMKTDLAKPMIVVGVKDEPTMKLLAPQYWEQRGLVHPSSVWVSGADQHYMAIRTDLRGDDTQMINPYTTAYFSYASLVLGSSFDRDLPLWFTRGLAGVVSNTIVRDNFILLGPPIPWHLEALRSQSRLTLKQLISVNRSSPEYRRGDGLERFDAEAWAFVHLLMFGEQGKYRSAINRFSTLLSNGKDVDGAFTEAIGRVEDLESAFSAYINSSIYSYQRAKVDATVSKERFQSHVLAPADVAAGRAGLYVAMGRTKEASASIGESRRLDPKNPASFVAEGLLFDRGGDRDQAKTAFATAVELGSSNAYAYYRSAVLKWPAGPQPDQQVLKEMETALSRAVELNSSYAAAYASLAEVRAALRKPAAEVVPLLVRAVELEPSNSWHRLTAARVFWRYDNIADARKAAQAALTLADTDAERTEAQSLLARLPKE
jgi:tetratricopeptide (TPR) repeat protein